jgi:hypothetical protein
MLGGKEHLKMSNKDKEPEKKSVSQIIDEVIADLVDDESVRKWYSTRPEGNKLRYYGD